jgi:uncharacterized protein
MKRMILLAVFSAGAVLAFAAAVRPGDMRLLEAAKKADVKTARALLLQKADANATEKDGSTVLHWAAQANSAELVDLLIGAGANVKAQSRYGLTPLYFAANNGNAVMLESLLKAGADANAANPEGQTALMTAARNGKADAVKVLLAHKADVNARESWKGQTALMWAAAENNADAAAMLIEFGGEVKAKSKGGLTPFLFAVRANGIETAKVLLDHGANINDVAPDGTSALAMATINAYFELAGILVDRGANPNLPDPRGSALHILAWLRKPGSDPAAGAGGAPKGPPIPQGNLDSLGLAKKLLAHGINPNTRVSWKEIKYNRDFGQVRLPLDIPIGRKYISYVGATAFYVAAQNGDAPYMRLLAAGGADTKLGTVQNISPLMAAAGIGYWDGESPGPYAGCSEAERVEAVKTAIELGNDVNYHADFGEYPMEGDADYIRLYYPKNISNMPENALGDVRWTGSTALHGAVISGQLGVVQYLVEHGAKIDAVNKVGWTPLTLAKGVFVSNTLKVFPEIAAYLESRMASR